MRYLARYVFKTATGNRTVRRLPDGQVLWPYRNSATGRPATVQLAALEWMGRLLQHILPPQFARVRTFGWLHPAAKVRANRVRALLREPPRLSPEEQAAWHPPAAPESGETAPAPATAATTPAPATAPESGSAPQYPHCRKAMRLVGMWRAGQPIPYPRRPP